MAIARTASVIVLTVVVSLSACSSDKEARTGNSVAGAQPGEELTTHNHDHGRTEHHS
jgi:hypothetical protein